MEEEWYEKWDRDKGDMKEERLQKAFPNAFVDRFFPRELRESKTGLLIRDMDISRLTVHIQQVEDDKRKQSGERNYQGGDNSRAQVTQSQESGGWTIYSCPPCQFFGYPHWGFYVEGRDKGFKYGRVDHHLKDFSINKVAIEAKKILVALFSASTPGGMASASITSPGFSIGRNRFYALTSRQQSEALPDIVTSTLQLFSRV
ncbi:uncharacterized protein LOC107876480 [Capsicum annuum]|uniref:uncharacterized protein LOC107876480 n=1 Tax=Capsicum annuum TaxID=4072 RepID=UPI001FB09349|nr:uncharacterized protein LOC107876480 [Capsicum annuum]